jgi:LacI family transcriptional regulator
MPRRVTLADVAQQAGVSRTTASFVLSGRNDMRISKEAQSRVLIAARELSYRPNLTARGLRTSVTHTVGFLSDSVATTQFAGEMIRGSLEAATAREHLLFIAETGGDPEVEARVVDGMLDRQVDGVVYATMSHRQVKPAASLAGRRVVLLNCNAAGFDAPFVVPDERAAGRAVAQAVLDAGHRASVHVIGGHEYTARTPDGAIAGHSRMRGIMDAFRDCSLRPASVFQCGWEPEHGYQAVSSLLSRSPRPTALICCNDQLALGAYQALHQAGLVIPDDVSVVSFDDSPLAAWMRPALASAALPHYEMGRKAVELVLATTPASDRPHLVPMEFELRPSLAAPAPRP